MDTPRVIGHMLTLLRITLTAALTGCVLAALFFGGPMVIGAYKEASFDTKDLRHAGNSVYEDRNGIPLRFMPDARGERRVWISGKDIPELLKDAFLASEDKRFYEHCGIDPAAIARAAADDLRAGCIVSGASTISQQVIRLVYPRRRTLHDKMVEAFRSIRMEGVLTKDEILEQYLNRVPMGNNIVGVELAAKTYFGKHCSELSASECALLASLPKAPGLLNPFHKDCCKLLARKDWTLSKMRELGFITEPEYRIAKAEQLQFRGYSYPYGAPHLIDMLMARGVRPKGELRTSLDLSVQTRVEHILASHRGRLGRRGAVQAAAIIIYNPTMEAVAYAGSMEYSAKDKGYNNGAAALRSAGSTLKPFLYGLALEKGATASELVEDTNKKYWSPEGIYSPYNFDRREYGPVTVRLALANSLNISAIKTLEKVGYTPFYGLLKKISLINHAGNGPGYYGLGLAVGNPEVSLEELVAAYAMLANGGRYSPVRYVTGGKRPHARVRGRQVMEPQTAYIITDILSDPSARSLTFGAPISMDFPYRLAMKTGTSTEYRDCWAVGYTREYTIGVWVGNFDGTPTRGLSGAVAAVPILADLAGFIYEGGLPEPFVRPKGVVSAKVCGYSGMRPTQNCEHVSEELFIAGTEPQKDCGFHKGVAGRHELGMSYASWLYDKYQQGTAGSYRMAGLSDDLGEAFEDASDTPDTPDVESPVRVYSAASTKPVSATIASNGAPSDGRPVTITSRRQDTYSETKWAVNRVHITYPMDGDRYLIDPYSHDRSIRLQALSDNPAEYVEWFVDGRPYSRTKPPYQAYWELKRGSHLITAVDPSDNGASVRITVE